MHKAAGMKAFILKKQQEMINENKADKIDESEEDEEDKEEGQ